MRDTRYQPETGTRILGRCVFGTGRGLFAEGTGILASAAEDARPFELRTSGADSPFLPGGRDGRLLRLPFLFEEERFDLVAIVVDVRDADGRSGFIAYGLAVATGDADACAEAIDTIIRDFKDVVSCYVVDMRVDPDAGGGLGEDAEAAPGLLRRVDDPGTAITLRCPVFSDHVHDIAEVLALQAELEGGRARSIVVGNLPGTGVRNLDAGYIGDLAKKVRARRDASRRRMASEARHPRPAEPTAAESQAAPVRHPDRDDDLAVLWRQVADLSRRVADLEQDRAAPRRRRQAAPRRPEPRRREPRGPALGKGLSAGLVTGLVVSFVAALGIAAMALWLVFGGGNGIPDTTSPEPRPAGETTLE